MISKLEVKEKNGLLQGPYAAISSELSNIVGFRMFPGDEHLLKDPNILGVGRGTHRVDTVLTARGGMYRMVVHIAAPRSGGARI